MKKQGSVLLLSLIFTQAVQAGYPYFHGDLNINQTEENIILIPSSVKPHPETPEDILSNEVFLLPSKTTNFNTYTYKEITEPGLESLQVRCGKAEEQSDIIKEKHKTIMENFAKVSPIHDEIHRLEMEDLRNGTFQNQPKIEELKKTVIDLETQQDLLREELNHHVIIHTSIKNTPGVNVTIPWKDGFESEAKSVKKANLSVDLKVLPLKPLKTTAYSSGTRHNGLKVYNHIKVNGIDFDGETNPTDFSALNNVEGTVELGVFFSQACELLNYTKNKISSTPGIFLTITNWYDVKYFTNELYGVQRTIRFEASEFSKECLNNKCKN